MLPAERKSDSEVLPRRKSHPHSPQLLIFVCPAIKECLYGMQIAPPALLMQLFTRIIISGQFETLALSHNLQVYGADRFVVGSESVPNAIRVSLISAQQIDVYKEGLITLRELLL